MMEDEFSVHLNLFTKTESILCKFPTVTWLWRGLPLTMLKLQSTPAVHLRTHFTRSITFHPSTLSHRIHQMLSLQWIAYKTYFPDNVQTLFIAIVSFWKMSHWSVIVTEIPICSAFYLWVAYHPDNIQTFLRHPVAFVKTPTEFTPRFLRSL